MTALAPLPGLERSGPPFSLPLDGPIWGIDPNTKRCAVGILEVSTSEVHVRWATLSFSQAAPLAPRLAAAVRDMRPFFDDQVDRYGVPVAVYLEQPFAGGDKPDRKTGKVLRPHPHSYYFVAAILTALGGCFPELDVQMIDPASWKARALGAGHGHCKPPEYVAWAESIGYTGSIEDEAAAIGIATGGAVMRLAPPAP